MRDKYTAHSAIFQYLVAIAAGMLCAVHAFSFYEAFIHRADFLYWDPAEHAFYGIRLTAAIQSFNPFQIFRVTNEQVLWPPLHSYIQFPFMLFLGKNFLASSYCSFTFLPVFFVCATFCYRQISEDWPGLLALLILMGSCSYYLGYSTMPMLEIFGAALACFCAALYLKGSRWFPAGLALLFFLKYNYCIYLALPIAAIELTPKILSFRNKTKDEILALFTPFRIFVAVYLAFLAVILITGGFKIGKVSVRGIGNPLYILFVLVLSRVFIKGQHKKIWRKIRGTGWEYFILPVTIWLLIPIPNRIKTLVSFSLNVPLGGHSPSDLSFYTFYFENLSVYFPSAVVLLVTVCLAAAFVIANWRRRSTTFLVFAFALPFLLMTLNQNKQERYLFTFVIFLHMMAACMIATIKQVWLRYVCVIALLTLVFYGYDANKTQELVAWPFIPVSAEEKVRFIRKEVVNANEITVVGVSNEISPSLLAYHLQKEIDFRNHIQLHWEVENPFAPNSHLIAIRPPAVEIPLPGLKLVKRKLFKDGTIVDHYITQ